MEAERLGNTATFAYRMEVTRENNKLSKWRLQDIAVSVLGDASRTASCLRCQNSGVTNVVKSGDNVHYTGLQTCGSIWQCPVCSQKIASRRREEVSTAVANCEYKTVLVTYTIQHSRKDKLKTLLDDLKGGLRHILNGRFRESFYSGYNVRGYIRSVEIRWNSKAGWHPHVHEMLLVRGDVDEVGIKSFLLDRYHPYLQKKGYHVNEHTLDLRVSGKNNEEIVSDYLTKSAIELEITAGQWKEGASLSPFQLLAMLDETGEAIYAELFREYADATAGRKWLTWSRGLREELLPDAEEEPDELIASSETEDDVILSLNRSEWGRVCGYGLRGHLLLAVSIGCDMCLWLDQKGIRKKEPD